MRRLSLAFIALVFAGCTVRQADLTIASNRNIDLGQVEQARRSQGGRIVEAKDVQHVAFIFPVTGPGRIEEAIDKAEDLGNGDCLVDAVIYQYGWYIPLIYGQFGWKVKGRPLDTYAGDPETARH